MLLSVYKEHSAEKETLLLTTSWQVQRVSPALVEQLLKLRNFYDTQPKCIQDQLMLGELAFKAAQITVQYAAPCEEPFVSSFQGDFDRLATQFGRYCFLKRGSREQLLRDVRERYGLDRIQLDEDAWDKFNFQAKLTEM